MKKFLGIGVILAFLLSFLSPVSITKAATPNDGHYIILFNGSIDQNLVEAHGGKVEKRFDSISSLAVTLPSKAAEALQHNPEVKDIEKDHQVFARSQSTGWGVKKVQAVPLLSSNLTGKGVKVAVLDSGIDAGHPDLRVAGGVSVLSYTNSYHDDNGHGTHVAGIIAAQNNNIGVVGVAPGVQLYAVKVLDQNGVGNQSDVIAGIEWAIQHHMDIINLSLSSQTGSLAMKEELERARNKGILIVGAAGNLGLITDQQDTVGYPARYRSVIAVAAINQNNQHPSFSATGPSVEFAAPGVEVKSTWNDGGYATLSGTSMAAPYVTGILAIYEQENPSVSPSRIVKVLARRAEDLGPQGRDSRFGYGLVQAPTIVKADITRPSVPQNLDATVQYTGAEWDISLSWDPARDNEKVTGYEVFRNGEKIATVSVSHFEEKAHCSRCRYQIRAKDAAGNRSGLSKQIHVSVTHFSDLEPDKWYAPDVHALYKKGLIKGYPDNTFRPENKLTRAEAATLISRAVGLSGTQRKTSFPDVHKGYWASGYIQSAHEKGIITGYPDGTFRPEHLVSREEIAYLLSRAFYFPTGQCQGSFTDVTKQMDSYEEIHELCEGGVAKGYPDHTFKPDQNITRAEFAAFLTRALNQKQ